MTAKDFDELQYVPRNLTYEEVENPYLVINDFFKMMHLPEVRKEMWELLKVIVVGDFNKSYSKTERADMIFFFEKLGKLVEAVHLIDLSRQNKKMTFNQYTKKEVA